MSRNTTKDLVMNSCRDLVAASHEPDHYNPLHKILPIAEPIQNLVLTKARKGIIEILGETKADCLTYVVVLAVYRCYSLTQVMRS